MQEADIPFLAILATIRAALAFASRERSAAEIHSIVFESTLFSLHSKSRHLS